MLLKTVGIHGYNTYNYEASTVLRYLSYFYCVTVLREKLCFTCYHYIYVLALVELFLQMQILDTKSNQHKVVKISAATMFNNYIL